MADGEFSVMFSGKSGGGSEGMGTARRNHLIEFPAEEPCAGGIDAVSETHGFNGHGEFADLIVGDAGCLELPPHACGVAVPVEKDFGKLAPCEEDEGTLVGPVESGHRSRDETTEAGALHGDERGIDLREGSDGIPGAAHIGHGLAHRRQEVADVRGPVRAAGSVARQMNQKGVELTRAQTACKGAAGHHALSGFVNDDDGGGAQQFSIAAAGLVPFEGHAVILLMAAGEGTRKAEQEVAMGFVTGFAGHGKIRSRPCELLEAGGRIGFRVTGRRQGVAGREGVARTDVCGCICRDTVDREGQQGSEQGGKSQRHAFILPQGHACSHGFSTGRRWKLYGRETRNRSAPAGWDAMDSVRRKVR
jgi:hypothetical protein